MAGNKFSDSGTFLRGMIAGVRTAGSSKARKARTAGLKRVREGGLREGGLRMDRLTSVRKVLLDWLEACSPKGNTVAVCPKQEGRGRMVNRR
ncbi:MAG: hypothetical protein LBT40_17410 [Deltaproteobacteria bacterium]|jgi:hypothetical protein|nr:hypothetical protein [Deltaproteobacteria bacterium]